MIPALARRNGDHTMTKDTTKEAAVAAEFLSFDNWAGTARRANDGAPRFPAYQRRTRAADALIAGRLSCRNQHAAGRRALACRGVFGLGRQGCGQPDLAHAWNARLL